MSYLNCAVPAPRSRCSSRARSQMLRRPWSRPVENNRKAVPAMRQRRGHTFGGAGQRDAAETGKHFLEEDPRLEPSERRTDAGVLAEPERQHRGFGRTPDVERIRVVPVLLVAVGRKVEQIHV